MVGLFGKKYGPIGIDLGSTAVKLLQLDGDGRRVLEFARWDLSFLPGLEDAPRERKLAEAIKRAMRGRRFRGHEAVFCIGAPELWVQNIRVTVSSDSPMDRIVCTEAANRLPLPIQEVELRYLETADIRQGEQIRREVIILACRREVLDRLIGIADQVGLELAGIDVETAAILRCYTKQYRRESDQREPIMFVNVGAARTAVVISQGGKPLFMKYIDIGGKHMDRAVAKHLQLPVQEAAALRRHQGDRRSDQRDPTVTQSIADGLRPVYEQLLQELMMCLRYYSVTFRFEPVRRVVLSGGEAEQQLADWLASRLDVTCEVGDPLRSFDKPTIAGRITQWDVAAGLALWQAS